PGRRIVGVGPESAEAPACGASEVLRSIDAALLLLLRGLLLRCQRRHLLPSGDFLGRRPPSGCTRPAVPLGSSPWRRMLGVAQQAVKEKMLPAEGGGGPA